MLDDRWKCARTRQQHFTPEEIALIEQRFNSGVGPRAVAFELKCSSRVIYTRYSELRGERQNRQPYDPSAVGLDGVRLMR